MVCCAPLREKAYAFIWCLLQYVRNHRESYGFALSNYVLNHMDYLCVCVSLSEISLNSACFCHSFRNHMNLYSVCVSRSEAICIHNVFAWLCQTAYAFIWFWRRYARHHMVSAPFCQQPGEFVVNLLSSICGPPLVALNALSATRWPRWVFLDETNIIQ